ncbi:MAG: HlyD family efflux transporter periplasmic adaptor subunit [Bacillota bacterium]
MGFNFRQSAPKIVKPANYAPGKRNMAKIYWYLLLVLILSPFVYLGYTIFTDTFLMTASGYITFGENTLRSPASAYVKKIMFKQGEGFSSGQKIIELVSPQLLSERQALQDEINVFKTQKQKYFTDNSEIAKLLQAKDATTVYIKKCQETLDAMQSLRENGATTIVDTANARRDLNVAEQQYYALEAEIARSETTKTVQSTEYFDKNILDTETKLRALNTSISLMNISVPEAGSMAKLFVQENEFVKEGQEIAKVVLQKDVFILAYIESKFLSEKLAAGQKVRIRFPNGTIVKGTVSADPVMAELDPSRSGIVSSDKNKIVVRVTPDEPVPAQYKIADLPVDVLFY